MRFEDLEFRPHHSGRFLRAEAKFPNGFCVSVIPESLADTFPQYVGTWEAAILPDGGGVWEPLRGVSSDQVTALLLAVEALQPGAGADVLDAVCLAVQPHYTPE